MHIHGTLLSESEIIGLAGKFLEPGFHELPVASMVEGRGVITTFLRTLDYYKAPACLSLTAVSGAIDLYELIHLNPDTSVAELLCSHIHIDFLWIEMCPEFHKAPWFTELLNTMEELHFDQVMPVMMVREE